MKFDKKDREKLEKEFYNLPEELFDSLLHWLKKANSAEEFAGLIMVGNCPECGSEKTRDGEGSPIDDITIGLCLKCGYVWCLECYNKLTEWPCPHWEICENCKLKPKELVDDEGNTIEGAYERCEFSEAYECPIIKENFGKGR